VSLFGWPRSYSSMTTIVHGCFIAGLLMVLTVFLSADTSRITPSRAIEISVLPLAQLYDEDEQVGRRPPSKDRAIRMTAIGSTVRYVREKLGMTQKAAAEALGVSSVHLSNVERGVTPPSAMLISRFAEVYGVDVYVLNYCTGEDEGDVPEGVRQARRKLAEALRRQLAETVKTG
jgi:transcriptional regulator with XRE-family HTH domain